MARPQMHARTLSGESTAAAAPSAASLSSTKMGVLAPTIARDRNPARSIVMHNESGKMRTAAAVATHRRRGAKRSPDRRNTGRASASSVRRKSTCASS